MSKTEKPSEKVYPTPLVTQKTRKPREGFKNPHKGIEVAPGLTLQDVPREMIIGHLKRNEQIAKERFAQKYGSMGGVQSF